MGNIKNIIYLSSLSVGLFILMMISLGSCQARLIEACANACDGKFIQAGATCRCLKE